MTRHYAWASDREAVKRLVPLPTVADRVCHFCRMPFMDVNDAWLELFDGPTLLYPVDAFRLRPVLAHTACGPDTGYNIRFSALLRDGADGWADHLSEKVWWAPTFEHELRDAHQLAKRVLQETARAERRRPENPRTITKATRAYVLERDGFRCRRCGATADDGVRLVIDHVVPVAKGGTADRSNLQTLCEPCNAGKADRDPHAHDHRVGGRRA